MYAGIGKGEAGARYRVVRATDQTKRKQLADEIQKVVFNEVPYVPTGQWVQPTAFRKNVRDILNFGVPIFWNMRVT
jgi:peptide/nickel transport system substrate-binding protein